jgi:DnaJ-class molecular chaperone
MKMKQDFYAILGLTQNATEQAIKKAFRQIARECHPDVAKGDIELEKKFQLAKEAYEVLVNKRSRAAYDRRGQKRVHSGGSFFDAFYRATGRGEDQSSVRTRQARRVHSAASEDEGNDVDLDDLFQDFGFGASKADSQQGRFRMGAQSSSSPARHGADIHLDVDVPAGIAGKGGSVTVRYSRFRRSDTWQPGSSDSGILRVDEMENVRVLPGTQTGETLLERGLGDAGAYGGGYGDLVLHVQVVGENAGKKDRHRGREKARSGTDPGELVTLDISLVEALLGGRVPLDTPAGRVRVTIPPCTSSGVRFRLKGKGAEDHHGQATDLVVEARIVVPAELDEESKRLIEEFAKLNPSL